MNKTRQDKIRSLGQSQIPRVQSFTLQTQSIKTECCSGIDIEYLLNSKPLHFISFLAGKVQQKVNNYHSVYCNCIFLVASFQVHLARSTSSSNSLRTSCIKSEHFCSQSLSDLKSNRCWCEILFLH